MKTKLLLLIMTVAVLIGGCAPDGCSLGVLTTKIPGYGPVESRQVYGVTFSLLWFFDNGVKNDNGKENISNETSGPESSTRQGSISSQVTAVRLANQPRGKGPRQAGKAVETEESKKAETKTNQKNHDCDRQSKSLRVRL